MPVCGIQGRAQGVDCSYFHVLFIILRYRRPNKLFYFNYLCKCTESLLGLLCYNNKKAVLPQGNRAMPQVFFSVEVRQQHSLQ